MIQAYHSIVARKRASAGSSYELEETFDGTGYNNPSYFSESGSVNEDYTTRILEGTHSLQVTGSNISLIDFSARDDVYCYFMLNIDVWSNFSDFLMWRELTSAGSLAGRCMLRGGGGAGGTVRVYHSSAFTESSATFEDDITYHVWAEWEMGSGGNTGQARLYMSTSAASKTLVAEVTNGPTTTNNVGGIRLLTSGSGENIYDRFILDTSPIPANP